MCKYEHLITSTASKEKIWHLWTRVNEWYQWDNSIKNATLEGHFAPGSKGSIMVQSGRQIPFVITHVDPNKSFTTVSKFFLCQLIFHHELHQAVNGAKITHRFHFAGPLGFLYSWLMGKKMDQNMSLALRNLATKAEHR